MILDFSIIINPVDHIYALLNHPQIKETIKEIFGWVTFIFGVREALYLTENGFKGSSTLVLVSKISLILSASVTRPGIFIASQISHLFIGAEELETMFGPYTIFLLNPWHPRHIVSFVALLLALPLTIQTFCDILNTTNKNVEREDWNRSLRLKTLFITFASRPILHIGNRLSGFLIRGA